MAETNSSGLIFEGTVAPGLIRRHLACPVADERLASGVKRWRNARTSVRHGILGLSKGAAARRQRKF